MKNSKGSSKRTLVKKTKTVRGRHSISEYDIIKIIHYSLLLNRTRFNRAGMRCRLSKDQIDSLYKNLVFNLNEQIYAGVERFVKKELKSETLNIIRE